MNAIRNIEELFYHELQVLWSAEKMLGGSDAVHDTKGKK